MRYIEKHNFEADLGRHSYRLGMNKYGDLTNTEYRKQLLGYHYNSTRSKDGASFLAPSFVQLPAEVDWRKKGYVTPVKDQVCPEETLLMIYELEHTLTSLKNQKRA